MVIGCLNCNTLFDSLNVFRPLVKLYVFILDKEVENNEVQKVNVILIKQASFKQEIKQ